MDARLRQQLATEDRAEHPEKDCDLDGAGSVNPGLRVVIKRHVRLEIHDGHRQRRGSASVLQLVESLFELRWNEQRRNLRLGGSSADHGEPSNRKPGAAPLPCSATLPSKQCRRARRPTPTSPLSAPCPRPRAAPSPATMRDRCSPESSSWAACG